MTTLLQLYSTPFLPPFSPSLPASIQHRSHLDALANVEAAKSGAPPQRLHGLPLDVVPLRHIQIREASPAAVYECLQGGGAGDEAVAGDVDELEVVHGFEGGGQSVVGDLERSAHVCVCVCVCMCEEYG